MRKLFAAAALMLSICSSLGAQTMTTELGYFGEIKTWLAAHVPYQKIEVDPLGGLGGEAKFATFADQKLLPRGAAVVEVPATEAVGKYTLTWQLAKMAEPDFKNIWDQYPRLTLSVDANGRGTGQWVYLYCQLVSPADMNASFILGTNCPSRFYINGKALPDLARTEGSENAAEVPIELKKGVNNVFVQLANSGAATFSCRLVGENAQPLREVTSQVIAYNSCPVVSGKFIWPTETWDKMITKIPPLPAHENPERLGVNLARTMQLLESGRYTKRPLRVMFYGQSIETAWTQKLVQQLRDRFPGTEIVFHNRAIGGWFVWRLMKAGKHDVIPWQPDLVVFSAYQGTAETWERFLAELRRTTTADIIIRTQHLSKGDAIDVDPEQGETVTLRRLARKYDVEFVEVRAEWMNYLKVHKLKQMDLLRDGIHLNENGETLMAQLYERHFVHKPTSTEGWANRVRRFDVMRFMEEGKTDEIVLKGDWQERRGWACSNSPEASLKLKFYGTRLDLVLPSGNGGASILIDGKKPSELKLFSGTRPEARTRAHYKTLPDNLMCYRMGKNMLEETWTLTFIQMEDKNATFRLVGSKTGPDGEGDLGHDFVSKSGRIIINASDWCAPGNRLPKPGSTQPASQPVIVPFNTLTQLVWHIVPMTMDTVYCKPLPHEQDYYNSQPYSYIPIADGLPCGVHEVTLTPLPGNDPFMIMGIDVHLPPFARDASQNTGE